MAQVPWLAAGAGATAPVAEAFRLKARPAAAAVPGAEVAGATDGAARPRAGATTRHPVGGARRSQAGRAPILALRPLAVIPVTERLGHAIPAVLTGEAAASTPILARVSPLLMGIAGTQEAMEAEAAAAARMGTPVAGEGPLPSLPARRSMA